MNLLSILKGESMKYYISIIMLGAFVLTGCGSKSGLDLSPEPTRKIMKNIPDWYLSTPTKDGFRYATATATVR